MSDQERVGPEAHEAEGNRLFATRVSREVVRNVTLAGLVLGAFAGRSVIATVGFYGLVRRIEGWVEAIEAKVYSDGYRDGEEGVRAELGPELEARESALVEMQTELDEANLSLRTTSEELQSARDDLGRAEERIEDIEEYAPGRREDRQQSYQAIVDFEKTPSELDFQDRLNEYFELLVNLTNLTVSHTFLAPISVNLEFMPRDEFNVWLVSGKTNRCHTGERDPNTINARASVEDDGTAVIRVPDTIGVFRGNRLETEETTINSTLRFSLFHELSGHAVVPGTDEYRLANGTEISFFGMRVNEDPGGELCRRLLWNQLNEAAADLTVLEMSSVDERGVEQAERWVRERRGLLPYRRMKALEFFITEAVGANRLWFIQQYYKSAPLLDVAIFDRHINARLARGDFDADVPDEFEDIKFTEEVFDLLDSGEIEAFYDLMEEELGLERPDQVQQQGEGALDGKVQAHEKLVWESGMMFEVALGDSFYPNGRRDNDVSGLSVPAEEQAPIGKYGLKGIERNQNVHRVMSRSRRGQQQWQRTQVGVQTRRM